MLPFWLRSWFTTAPRPSRPGHVYFAQCQACLSILEVGTDGELIPTDERSTQEQEARWQGWLREQNAELESQTAALMERGT